MLLSTIGFEGLICVGVFKFCFAWILVWDLEERSFGLRPQDDTGGGLRPQDDTGGGLSPRDDSVGFVLGMTGLALLSG